MSLQIDSACNHSGGPVVGGRAQPRAPCARLVRKKLEPGVCARASFDVSVPPTVTATQAEGVVGKKKCVKSNQGGGAAGAAAARCSGRERGAERIRAAELVSCCGGRFSISLFWPPDCVVCF